MNKKRITEIYIAIDLLLSEGCFLFVEEHLITISGKVWRTDIEELIAYATVTLPYKNKLSNRKMFIKQCQKFHPNYKKYFY